MMCRGHAAPMEMDATILHQYFDKKMLTFVRLVMELLSQFLL